MALTINSNLSSIIAQQNLAKATSSLNKAIEKMSTGYKLNKASDDAAGYSISRNWDTQLGSLDLAADNAAAGSDMVSTMEENYTLVSKHLQRVRELTEQASNGTYGESSKQAIEAEIASRLEEIDRIASNCEFNGKHLMDSSVTSDVNIQVGINAGNGNNIQLSSDLFESVKVADLFSMPGVDEIAAACAGANSSDMLDKIDDVMKEVSGRTGKLGAAHNMIGSAIETISVYAENITSSLSTLRDADVVEASSKIIQSQILQQSSSTLLSTANQTPSIALSLL